VTQSQATRPSAVLPEPDPGEPNRIWQPASGGLRRCPWPASCGDHVLRCCRRCCRSWSSPRGGSDWPILPPQWQWCSHSGAGQRFTVVGSLDNRRRVAQRATAMIRTIPGGAAQHYRSPTPRSDMFPRMVSHRLHSLKAPSEPCRRTRCRPAATDRRENQEVARGEERGWSPVRLATPSGVNRV
jgi:hypothetical protein